MNNSILSKLSNSWKLSGKQQKTGKIALDTLAAFVRDTEHELISVATSLQAHLSLLKDENVRLNLPVDRFVILNRAVARIIRNTDILSAVSDQAQIPRSKQKVTVETLVTEVIEETRAAFAASRVSICYEIAKHTTLVANSVSLKLMIKEIILEILLHCKKLETLNIIGQRNDKNVSMSFDIDSKVAPGEFTSWQLGGLRLLPTSGEGITMSSIDAVARLYNGNLSVRTSADQRHGYKLNFKI